MKILGVIELNEYLCKKSFCNNYPFYRFNPLYEDDRHVGYKEDVLKNVKDHPDDAPETDSISSSGYGSNSTQKGEMTFIWRELRAVFFGIFRNKKVQQNHTYRIRDQFWLSSMLCVRIKLLSVSCSSICSSLSSANILFY